MSYEVIKPPVNQVSVNQLIRDILWEMQHFGKFGIRQKYIQDAIKNLQDAIDPPEVCSCCKKKL